jgi:pimeloyl-[acyl-carrier protein] synthase
MFDLLGEAFHADPAPVFARMRRERPVHRDAELGTWVLSRYADVAQVIRDPAFSVDRGGSISRGADPGVERELAWCSEFALRWMVFADPPRHSRLRAAVYRAFTSSVVERLRPVVERACADVLDEALPAGRIELIADLATPVPALVTAALLGLPAGDVDRLKRWTADMFDLLGAGLAPAEVVLRAHRSMQECSAYFADVVATRRARGGDDLLAQVVGSPEGAELDEDELIGLCVTLVAGAYETTTHLVGNGIWQLLRHPDQLAALRGGAAPIENAVEELFRFDGPALSVVRRAREDVAVGGVTIPAGDNVYCMLYAANRDPERHPDPDRLDLGRADTRHLGLGHGIHFCLGAALSRLEAQVMIDAIVRLDGLALDRDALGAEAPTYRKNLAIRGLHALPLRFTPRHRAFRST